MRNLPKLIALDLDETLLDRDSRLPEQEALALKRAMAAGAEIALATGRAYATIPEEMLRFPGIRYAVTGNGAAVYDCRTGQAVLRRTLPPGAAKAVLERTAAEDVSYEAFLEGRAYAQADYLEKLHTFMMDRHTQAYVRATRIPVADIRRFVRENGDAMDSLAVIPRDMDTKRRVIETLRKLDEVYITTSSIRLIEVNHESCTKQAGLQNLAALLGVSQVETAAFGNADNDAEMLAWAGTGFL